MIKTVRTASVILGIAAMSAVASMVHASVATLPVQPAPAPPLPTAAPVSYAAIPADKVGKALFELNCSGCHEVTEATSKKKDPSGWAATVEKMVAYGAPVANDDQKRIVDYLAATYPLAKPG